MKRLTLFSLLLLCAACSNAGDAVLVDSAGADLSRLADAAPETVAAEEVAPELPGEEDTGIDLQFDTGTDGGVGPGCEPGEGCFLDPCDGNDDCLSGWCVDHMGEEVCTVQCQSECPQGWSCQQVAGTAPDLIFVCVSAFANLCRPCATADNCKSVGGADDVCVDYGTEGSFCGGACLSDKDCPWGFSCGETLTVDGISTKQCVAETGSCPCTASSVKLGLWTPCEVTSDHGTCTGKRVCTASGLSECDAAAASIEVCNGVDDDCDGDVDEPDEVGGNYVNLCDDGNECTQDICAGEGGCTYEDLNSDECKDGDPCTVGDHCEAGVCVGQLVDCDDGNPCTDDWCNPAGGCAHGNSNEKCDDGNACTVADECQAGECVGVSVNCECQQDSDCAALEDDNLCNGTLTCSKEKLPYQCKVDPGTVVTCAEPTGPEAVCLQAACDPATGACSVEAAHEGYACDSGNPCTVGDKCVDGACTPGVAVGCNDGNPCTDDSCSDEEGCIHTPNAAVCTDNNACTVGDHCEAGACAYTALLSCDDDNVCTTDYCDPKQGCSHKLNKAPCDDGSVCTTGDHCHLGECISSGTLSCDDGNPCTVDSCNPAAGCAHGNSDGACDDGNECTLGDHCAAGKCVAAEMLACNDDNLCTTDSCSPQLGCVNAFNQVPCDDGDVCTLADHCQAGACAPGSQLDCDDSNPCTDDACDPAQGCTHTPNDLGCTDGNACTTGDQCVAGACVPSGMLTCDDGNLCTNDNCDPQVGCVYSANTQPCSDGNACTENDACKDGLCVPGSAKVCPDDGNPCTSELCEPDAGCTSDLVPDCCGNGVVEAGETCDDGNFQDGDGCAHDCQSESGCSNQAEFHYQVVPGIWACVNNALITTYQENNAMCGSGFTPATYKLVQGLPMPSLQQHQQFVAWYTSVMPNNGNYIRTGQKRRGGCTAEAHGDLYVPNPDWGYKPGSGWHDLFQGGSSCLPDTGSANNMSHPLAGVICVAGQYEPPQP